MRIEVFPDYCSTGLWDTESRANIDPESSGVSDPALLLALKYWHWTWEFLVVNDTLSAHAVQTWVQDGAQLVKLLNERYAGVHEFVYRSDLLEVSAPEHPTNS